MPGCDLKDRSDPENGRSKKIKMESIPYQLYKDEQYKSKLGDRAYEIMDQKRKKAVKETIGKVITYKGTLIEPYFHAVSVGMTLDASEWFGKKIPYLRQKESLSDIESKDYMSIKTISYQRMQIILERTHEKENHHTTITKKSETFNGNKEWICQTDQGRIIYHFRRRFCKMAATGIQ